MELIRSDVFYLFIDLLFLSLFCLFVLRGLNVYPVAVFSIILFVFKLVIFVGMRPFDAGNDTIGYYNTFQLLDGVSGARYIGGTYGGTEQAGEVLYWPFVALVKPLLGDSFRAFLIFSILVSGYLSYLVNRKLIGLAGQLDRKDQFATAAIITYLVFLSFEIAYFGGHIRSAFGVPLAVLSFYFAARGRILVSIFVFLLAIGFHNSVITILPLLLIIALFKFRVTSWTTMFLIFMLVASFFAGKYDMVGEVAGLFSGYYSERYKAYVNYEGFNISSVYSTVYFWIILLHVLFFLVVGYGRAHFYVFYYVSLIFLFSSTPKISERFFAYILICLPLFLYMSLRYRLKNNDALLVTVLIYSFLSPFVVTSYAVSNSLNIFTYIYSWD